MSRRALRRRASRAEGQGVQSVAPATERGIRDAQSGGHMLDEGTRRWFEARSGAGLGAVRLHDDNTAATLSEAVGARAFTVGSHVFLGDGERRGEPGRRLIAHELAHVVQEGGAGPAGTIRRQPAPPAPAAPTTVTLNFNQTIPVPPVGTRTLQATCDVNPVTWSITAGSTTPAAGTSVSATGVIGIGAAQTAGTVRVRATNAAGAFADAPIQFGGIPTGIDSTAALGNPPGANYGNVFDHVFASSTGTVADLDGVGVGERFPGLATPNAADHVIPPPLYPFGGSFTLHTATLTADATNNWFLTAAGGLGGTMDTVSIGQAGVQIGRFVQSASNPRPLGRLPAGFTIDQHLHWYNPLAASAAARWTDFATVSHSRFLTNSGGTIAFETTVNGVSDGGDTYVGNVAVTNLAASPVNTPKSAGPPAAGGPAPAARTVALTVDALPSSLPAGQALVWSIQGAALGCTVAANANNPLAAVLTVGQTAGTVTIRVADASGTNFDEVRVRIT